MTKDNIFQFGFDGATPTPPNLHASLFAQKISAMLSAENRLEVAYSRVPDYTGQWDAKDYYAQEQEDYNRACDDLWNFAKDHF